MVYRGTNMGSCKIFAYKNKLNKKKAMIILVISITATGNSSIHMVEKSAA